MMRKVFENLEKNKKNAIETILTKLCSKKMVNNNNKKKNTTLFLLTQGVVQKCM